LRPGRSPRAEVAVTTLIDQEQPDTSLVVMPVLARRKGIVGEQMKSCAVLAAGLVLNALFGWWWADPLAALRWHDCRVIDDNSKV
jgi:hypothetical protein